MPLTVVTYTLSDEKISCCNFVITGSSDDLITMDTSGVHIRKVLSVLSKDAQPHNREDENVKDVLLSSTVQSQIQNDRQQKESKNTSMDCMTLLRYEDAPSYLQFNPYILNGYRGYMSTKMCLESMFWMTNETINIWSHIFGWMLFLGLTLYDLFLLNIHASFTDKFIVGLLLGCFQICMVMSSLYHIFSCRSEEHFNCFLSFDLLGIALSMLGIYMTGVYYAYWCHKGWQTFYLSTVCAIFLVAMLLQLPSLKIDSNVKLMVFVLWAVYGVVPTLHWTVMMGGLENPVVSLLLPRVIVMYGIIGLAFFIYITRVPERFFTGKVDYIGSSHQLWHFFVVVALYYWHNTGIKYIEYRMNHGCSYDMRL